MFLITFCCELFHKSSVKNTNKERFLSAKKTFSFVTVTSVDTTSLSFSHTMKATLLLCVVLFSFPFAFSADTIRNCSCVAFRLDDIQDYYVVKRSSNSRLMNTDVATKDTHQSF